MRRPRPASSLRRDRGLPEPPSSAKPNLNSKTTMSEKTHPAESTSHDLKSLLREAEQALAGEAGDKVEELRDRLRAAINEGRYSLAALREETVRRAKQADGLIRENPYYAIGVAAGVGALIGILVCRQRQH
jgi:ElaB/YqjD/DUF883 family membrane-anchored ribosome-binding protein